AKPAAITFPLLAALLELWQRRTITRRYYLLPLLLAGAVAALAAYAQAVGGATSALADGPLTARLLNAMAAIGAYGWQTLWPRHLALQCQHRWPLLPHYWQHGLIVTLLLGVGLTLLIRRLVWQWQHCAGEWQTNAPWWQVRLTAALLFPLLAVAPMLGIAHFGIHARADRFTYLPAIGISMLLLAVGARLTRRLSRRRRLLLAAAGVAALLLLAQQTQQQARLWRNEATLFGNTLALDGPENIQAHLALSKYHYEVSHNLPLARHHLTEALQRDPANAGQYGFLLAIMLLEEGETAAVAAVAAQQLAWVEEFKRRLAANDAKATQLRYAIPSLLAFAAQHIAEGDYELAQEKLDYLARLRPDSPWVPWLRYLQAQRQGDVAAAAKARRAVRRAHGEPYLRHRFLE
ncbi:MAG: hypothetical protein GX102_16340, partial [Porphyromonadaceae bacterium]|nr:hypothetical protein [Porphyromonadaceae bacterium]